MKRLPVLFCCFFLLAGKCRAQETEGKALSRKDSLAILNELLQMLDSAGKPSSYFMVSAGISNRMFSVRNNLLKTKQVSTHKLVLSPAAGYFHRSGLSLSVTSGFVGMGNCFGLNQFAVNPAYDLQNSPAIGLSASYTHYFVGDYYSAYASPVENDLYGSFYYKKTLVEPGVSLSYSTGKFNETYYWRNRDGLRRYDSVSNRLQTMALVFFAGHHFEWYGLFHKKDALQFYPAFMLNTGKSKLTPTNKTNATLVEIRNINRMGRLPKVQTTNFQAESIGLNTDASYTFRRAILEASAYTDYYLPATTGDRFSFLFSLTLGVMF